MLELDVNPLLGTRVLQKRVRSLAVELLPWCQEEGLPLVLGVLNGSFIFLADLLRNLPDPLEVEFLRSTSYGSGTEPGNPPRVQIPDSLQIKGRRVLLVDDILDTGNTLSRLFLELQERGAHSVRSCVLLDKPSRRQTPISAQHVGFIVEDYFVVGYGLDFAGRYRNLPAIHRMLEIA